METITFLVQGSAPEPYRVTIKKKGHNLNMHCTCPASTNGHYCKHRFSILGGETGGLASGNEAEINTVMTWLPGSDVAAAMEVVIAAVRDFEKAGQTVIEVKKRLAESLVK